MGVGLSSSTVVVVCSRVDVALRLPTKRLARLELLGTTSCCLLLLVDGGLWTNALRGGSMAGQGQGVQCHKGGKAASLNTIPPPSASPRRARSSICPHTTIDKTLT